MPHKQTKDADGVKSKGRSKKDKAKRSFDLNGTYSSKHLRLREAQAAAAWSKASPTQGQGQNR